MELRELIQPMPTVNDIFSDVAGAITVRASDLLRSSGLGRVVFSLPRKETVSALAKSKLENGKLGNDITIDSSDIVHSDVDIDYLIIKQDGTLIYKTADGTEDIAGVIYLPDVIAKAMDLWVYNMFKRIILGVRVYLENLVEEAYPEKWAKVTVYRPTDKVVKKLSVSYTKTVLRDRVFLGHIVRAFLRSDDRMAAKILRSFGNALVVGPYTLSSNKDVKIYAYPSINKIAFGGKLKKIGLVNPRPKELRLVLDMAEAE